MSFLLFCAIVPDFQTNILLATLFHCDLPALPTRTDYVLYPCFQFFFAEHGLASSYTFLFGDNHMQSTIPLMPARNLVTWTNLFFSLHHSGFTVVPLRDGLLAPFLTWAV
ncbi:hypothetical protein K435DRAFT_229454 [Dendrothele bispora CBS 962.96]|uniref:Uncharacterized protein n=1 Tax=Dendrothele bispora (strain CBS 962.96) TaxID=1314807 RepID=A0A4S8MM70_DENBC|nr:hypothetical protein K435DRAFT_229454 [Dendrothele bispora CBS 962.96]